MSNDMLTEIQFWAQVTGDAKRTVLCAPDLESRIKGWISARNMDGLLCVIATPYCPTDRVFIVDEQALQAAHDAALQKMRIRF